MAVDWLVQRYIDNAPNSTTGGWVDEGTTTDFKADEPQQAVEQLANSAYPGARRAVRREHIHTFDIQPGPPTATPTDEGVGEVPT